MVLLEVIDANTDCCRTPYPYHSPFDLHEPFMNPTTPFISSTTHCGLVTRLYGPLYTSSTCYESFLPVISFFQPSITFVDALRYTIWQIYVGKSMMVRRSGARDLTLHL
jgi:hypothetical protein